MQPIFSACCLREDWKSVYRSSSIWLIDKKSAKSLLEKQYAHYERRASDALWMFKRAQDHFRGMKWTGQNIELPTDHGQDDGPIIEVGFYPDRIETARLMDDGILKRTVTVFDQKRKTRKVIEEKTERRWPGVIFGDESVFEIKNYSPPAFSSSDGFDQLT